MTHPRGRPTKYKPEFCDEIIRLRSEGKCKTEAALALGVDRTTLNEWIDKYPEFSIAAKRARDAHKALFLKQVGENLIDNGKIRLNIGAVRFYAYSVFGISENSNNAKNSEIPAEFYDTKTTVVRKQQIIDEMLAKKQLSVVQYSTLTSSLDRQFERVHALKIKQLLDD